MKKPTEVVNECELLRDANVRFHVVGLIHSRDEEWRGRIFTAHAEGMIQAKAELKKELLTELKKYKCGKHLRLEKKLTDDNKGGATV